MRRFRSPRRDDDVEQLLRRHRGVPRDDFVASLLERLQAQPERMRPRHFGVRVLVATALTALVVGVGVAAGATHVVGTSITSIVHVANSGIHGPTPLHNGDKDKDHYPGPGDHQYVVPVCHHLNNRIRPWVELYLPPRLAAFFVRFFPPDYIVGYDGNPDTCPP